MTQVVPTVLYPILQSTASHEASDVQALHVPFSTGMVEQEIHVLPLKYSPAEQRTLSHTLPFALYPSLHDTAVQVPVDEHAVHTPLDTGIVEQALHVLPLKNSPVEQVILSHLAPFALYPSLHDTAVQVPVDEQAVHTPLETEMVEQALHVLPLKYSPVEQVILSHLAPFALYPSLHDTAVQIPVNEQAVQVPFSTAMAEHG